jgi:hypothetical protein
MSMLIIVDILELKDGFWDQFSTGSTCVAGVTYALFTVKNLLTF